MRPECRVAELGSLGRFPRMDLSPLVFDALLGFVASVCTPSAVVRFFAWFSIPIIIALVDIGPIELAHAHGESSMLWLAFGYLVVLGFLASGVGTLGGYFVRRMGRQQSS
jgi:Na+/H+-dicarboxylate symporter